MKYRILNLIIIIVLFSVISSCKLIDKSIEIQSDDLVINKLSENVYQHISYLQTENWGKVACNGMIVVEDGEAIIFDTPVDNKSSQILIEKLSDNGVRIIGIVPTHFHVDCVGGLDTFGENKTQIFISNETIGKIASYDEFTGYKIKIFEDKLSINIGTSSIQLEYLGAGHTTDNIVGYYDKDKILFGGCLVKAVGSMKGNLADADVEEWSNTVRKVKEKYPNADIVVPGHGKTGGVELLDYTIELFEREKENE